MKLVIFDLDGTLVNTLDDLANSANHALQLFNYPPHPIEAYKLFVGNGIRTLIQRCVPESERTDEIIEKVKAEFVTHYELHSKDTSKPYEGIVELLQNLKEQGFLISVASNKYHTATVELVDYYFPYIQFDLVLGHRDNHPPKPDPDIVLDTLTQLQIHPNNCYYIGDSSVDMLTAKNANVKAIGVSWGFRSEEELLAHGADYIIHSPMELLNIVRIK